MVEIGTDHPSPRSALDVSADGTVIVGRGDDGRGSDEGFIWTEESGTVLLPRVSGNATRPQAISADGTTVVGGVQNSLGYGNAFYWTNETGIVILPMLPGQVDAAAYAVSSDGSVIVGLAGFGARDPQDGPFIYNQKTGELHLLAEVLIDLGLGDQFADHDFRQVWDISADGLVVLGDSNGGKGNWLISLDRLPRYGDFNHDGDLSIDDIGLLISQLGLPKDKPGFDLNRDQVIDDLDLEYWIEKSFHSYFGDADLNGAVDFADFLTLADHFDQSGGWSDGDFDGSGTVGFPDFLLLADNFGQSSAVAAVPESSTLTSALLVVVGIVGLRHRRSCRLFRCESISRFETRD
jgi:hypothetical protein